MAAHGHTGTGGAFAWCDRDRRMSFACCTNFQREGPGIGPRGAALAAAAGGGLGPSWLTLRQSGDRLSLRAAAKMLTALGNEYGTRIVLEPLPPVAPKVFSNNLPERPNVLAPLVRLIAGER